MQKLEEIPHTPNHRIILMGDLLDVGIRSAIGGSVYENTVTTDVQIEKMCEMLMPWKDQIDGAVQGNHENRIFKECGIDVTKMLSDRLEIPYMKYSGIITYSLCKRAYHINFFHGKAGGSVENALRSAKAMSVKAFADVYMMGHCHHSAHTKRQYKYVDSRNKKIVEMTQYFVLTGSSLDYDDSYADQMNLEISTQAFPVITLHGNTPLKKIEVSS